MGPLPAGRAWRDHPARHHLFQNSDKEASHRDLFPLPDIPDDINGGDANGDPDQDGGGGTDADGGIDLQGGIDNDGGGTELELSRAAVSEVVGAGVAHAVV